MEPKLNDLEWPSSFSLELAEIDEKTSGISGIIAVVYGRVSIIALHDEQRLKRGNHPMLTEPDNLSVPVNIIYNYPEPDLVTTGADYCLVVLVVQLAKI